MTSVTTILVVDDDRDLANTLADVLEMVGYTTVRAYSGEEALSAVEDRELDAALLDVKLPGMDGIQCLEQLRARYPGVVCLVMTGFEVEGLADRVSRQGAATLLHKPFSGEQLLEALDKGVADKH